MIYKNIFFSITLLSIFSDNMPKACLLTNKALKTADAAGLFDGAIIDILRVRKEVKEIATGKYIYSGTQFSLPLYNANKEETSVHIDFLLDRPSTLFGATFAVISTNHPQCTLFASPEQKPHVEQYITTQKSRATIDLYTNPDFTIIAAGTYIKNPMTNQLIPVFVGNYNLEAYDTRTLHTHIAIPAHNLKDFFIAEQYNLPIKLVISTNDLNRHSAPQIDKTTNTLRAAYSGNYSDCIIVNSDFLNGSIKKANETAAQFLKTYCKAFDYKQPILYFFTHKWCSLNDLQALEKLLEQEHKILNNAQQTEFDILLFCAKSDFLNIVEQFLINAREVRGLMTELIEESCALRNVTDGFLLTLAHTKTTNNEKVIFTQEVDSFYKLCKFCAELIDFLEDFGSSCTHAITKLKNLQNNR